LASRASNWHTFLHHQRKILSHWLIFKVGQ
jgi:hypothetical protein